MLFLVTFNVYSCTEATDSKNNALKGNSICSQYLGNLFESLSQQYADAANIKPLKLEKLTSSNGSNIFVYHYFIFYLIEIDLNKN